MVGQVFKLENLSKTAVLDVASGKVLKGCSHPQHHSPTETHSGSSWSISKLASLHPSTTIRLRTEKPGPRRMPPPGLQRDPEHLKHTHTQMLFINYSFAFTAKPFPCSFFIVLWPCQFRLACDWLWGFEWGTCVYIVPCVMVIKVILTTAWIPFTLSAWLYPLGRERKWKMHIWTCANHPPCFWKEIKQDKKKKRNKKIFQATSCLIL